MAFSSGFNCLCCALAPVDAEAYYKDMKKTPSELEINGALAAAKTAVAHGVTLRTRHRRRTSPGGILRAAEFEPVLRELRKAARPIRVLRGMEASHPEVMSHQDELEKASLAIRGEKRRLKKMLR